MMKILIYGAGPLGSLYAARLIEAEHDVSILARGRRLADLREHGIIIENPVTGEKEITPVNTVEALEPEDDYDLVMVVMRKNHAVDILSNLAANEKVPTFLFMMNDVAGPQPLVKALGVSRVMRGFPLPGGTREDPVVKIIPANEQRPWELPIGEVDGSISSRTREVAAVLSSMRGFTVDIRSDMDAWLKYHFAFLAPFGMALYAVGLDLDRLGRSQDALVMGVRGIKESIRSMRSIGIPVTPRLMCVFEWLPEPLFVWLVRQFLKVESLRVSLEGHPKAAPDEMKFLTDELLKLLHNNGAYTPTLDWLYRFYDPDALRIPDRSSKIPMKWSGLVIPGLVALLLILIKKGKK